VQPRLRNRSLWQPPVIGRHKTPHLFRAPDLKGIAPNVLDRPFKIPYGVQESLPSRPFRPHGMSRTAFARFNKAGSGSFLKMSDHVFGPIVMPANQDVHVIWHDEPFIMHSFV